MRMLTGSQQGVTFDLPEDQRRLLDIRQYVRENPQSDYDYLQQAQRFNVTPEEIALALGADPEEIRARYQLAELAQRYIQQNPNQNPLELLQAAQAEGYTPEQIRMLSGSTPEEILKANPPQNEKEASLFSSTAKNFIKDSAINALLMSNPYTAPFAVAFNPVKNLFSNTVGGALRKLF